MERRKTIILVIAFVSLLCTAAVRAQATKPAQMTALNLLRAREPKVTWKASSLLKADFDYDGVDDYALGGEAGSRYFVGVVKGPISTHSKHWTMGFSADPGDQASLCSVSTAQITLEPLDDERVEGASKLPPNGSGINLSDGACDS